MDRKDFETAHRLGDDLYRGDRRDASEILSNVMHDRDALSIINIARRDAGPNAREQVAVDRDGTVTMYDSRDRRIDFQGRSRELADQLYEGRDSRYPNQNYPDGNVRRDDRVPPYYGGDQSGPPPYYPNDGRGYPGPQVQVQVPWELDPRNHSNGRHNPYSGQRRGNSDTGAVIEGAVGAAIIIDAITGRRRY